MGANAGAMACLNRAVGSLISTAGGSATSDPGKPASCSLCGCSTANPTSPQGSTPPFDSECKLFITTGYATFQAAKDALAKEAQAKGYQYEESRVHPIGGSGSTRVTADVSQGSLDVTGMHTVGGRQQLRTANGVLDLRWYLNQGFSSDTFAKVPHGAGTGTFDPGGEGGTFGFLHWLKQAPVPPFGEVNNNQFYSGAGGLTRTMAAGITDPPNGVVQDKPFDGGDTSQYNTKSAPYYKYQTAQRSYFWYNGGDLGDQDSKYVSKLQDNLGYTLYYNYVGANGTQLRRLGGDLGQLVPYFGYDSGNRINRIYLQDSAGTDHRATYYYYDSNGALNVMIEPTGPVTYFSISAAGGPFFGGNNVIKEVDPAGYVTYFTYDSNYGLSKLNWNGRVYNLGDTGGGNAGTVGLSGALFPSGAARSYKRLFYSSHGFGVTDEVLGGAHTGYTMDSNGVINSITDPNGNVQQYQNTAMHYHAVVQGPDNGIAYFGYASNGMDVTAYVGPRNSASFQEITYYGYLNGPSGLRTTILDPFGNATYFGYDSRNRLVRTLDRRKGYTYYGYDAFSRTAAVLDALNGSAYFGYNANGRVLRTQDGRGFTTYFTYDALDQQLSTILPTGELSTNLLDARGLVKAQGRPGGRAVYYQYDAFKNPVVVAQLNGPGFSTGYYYYDDYDNLGVTTDPVGNITYFGYDYRRKQLRIQNALAQVTYYAYDPSGNLTQQLDARGNWTQWGYDPLNRPNMTALGVAGIHPPRQSAIQGHWKLNETSGNRQDDSGNSNTLSANGTGGVGSTAGWIGNAALLVQSNSNFLSISDLGQHGLGLTGDMTLAAWVKLNSLPTAPPLSGDLTLWPVISKSGGNGNLGYIFGISTDTSGAIYVTLILSQNGSFFNYYLFVARPSFATGAWRHIAVTFQAATASIALYVDGMPVLTPTGSVNGIFSNVFDFQIGAMGSMSPFAINTTNSVYPNFFDGAIDEAYVFNAVLTQREISLLAQQRMEFTLSADPSNVIATYFGYDLDGNRTTSVDGNGNVSYFAFDALNRMVVSTDALQNSIYYSYDQNGNQTKALNSRQFSTYFGYDGLNRKNIVVNALREVTYYGFDPVGNKISALYADLSTEYFAYDGSRRLTTYQDRGGFSTYFGFDVAGNGNRAQDARLNTTYFGYDLLDRRAVIQDALQQITYFGYDSVGNLVRQQDHLTPATSAATYYYYDALNRSSAVLDPMNRASYFGYDVVGNQLRTTLPGTPLKSTYYGYDQFSRLCQKRDAAGNVTYFGYDRAGNRVQLQNPRGFTTYWGYDALNRVKQTLDALNGTTYFVFDPDGDTSKQRDVRGFWTYYIYDGLDRLTQIQDPMNGISQRGFDSVGNLSRLQPAVGNATYFYYEARNLLIRTVDGVGNPTQYTYDAVGNRISITTANGTGYGTQPYGTSAYGGVSGTTYFGYDALNRLVQVLDPVGGNSYFGYDIAGNMAKLLDPLLRATYFGYDLLDRIVKIQNADLNTVYFGYDQAGNRAIEVDPLQHTTYYSYDISNRLGAILDPLARPAYYGYDQNSNLAKTLDNNRTATYFGYDALDRRTVIQFPAENQYFGYDAGGNLIATKDNWGNSYFGYDALSRLVARSTPLRDSVYYAYDSASKLCILQYPQDNKACYYGYDVAQRVTQVLSPYGNAAYWLYDADSNVTQKTFGNGMISWANFDGSDRITSLRYVKSDGSPIVYFDYNRDVSGRINIINRELTAGYTIYYSYDNVDRLIQETWRKQTDNTQIYAFSYSYDASGNRLAMRREGGGVESESAYYSYAADNSLIRRVVQPAGNSTYWYYDAAGNTLVISDSSSGVTYFGYGPYQLLTQIQPPTEAASYFYYDIHFNRYCENRAGSLTYFLWDGPNLLEERNADGSLKVRYTHGYTQIPGIASIIEAQRMAGGATYYQYYCMDHRGSAVTVTDSSQNSLLVYSMDAFGRQLGGVSGSTPALPNEMIYQTNWRTPFIGGQYYWETRTRFGDPVTGRFLGRDFLGTPAAHNLYIAFKNQPTAYVDPTGLLDFNTLLKFLAGTYAHLVIYAEYAKTHDTKNVWLNRRIQTIVNEGWGANAAKEFAKDRPDIFKKVSTCLGEIWEIKSKWEGAEVALEEARGYAFDIEDSVPGLTVDLGPEWPKRKITRAFCPIPIGVEFWGEGNGVILYNYILVDCDNKNRARRRKEKRDTTNIPVRKVPDNWKKWVEKISKRIVNELDEPESLSLQGTYFPTIDAPVPFQIMGSNPDWPTQPSWYVNRQKVLDNSGDGKYFAIALGVLIAGALATILLPEEIAAGTVVAGAKVAADVTITVSSYALPAAKAIDEILKK